MDSSLIDTVADRLPHMLGFVAFQAIVGVSGFRTYRRKAGRPAPTGDDGGDVTLAGPESWEPGVTALAMIQYLLLTVGSAAVFAPLFPRIAGVMLLLWIALIVYFAMAGMMLAVMFPPMLLRATSVLVTPVVLALLMHFTRDEPLTLSLVTQLLFMGILYVTVLPGVLVAAFLRIGFGEVKGSWWMLAVNLAVIGPLAALPVFMWIDLVPAAIGGSFADEPLAWLGIIASALVMVVQYYLGWRHRVRPLVEAGRL